MNRHSFYNSHEHNYIIMYNTLAYYNIMTSKIILPFGYQKFNLGLAAIIHDKFPLLYCAIQFLDTGRMVLIQMPDIPIDNEMNLHKLLTNMSISLLPMSIELNFFIKNDYTWEQDKKIVKIDVRNYPEISYINR